MKRKAAREEEEFKNRINPGGVYTAHRDSDGEPLQKQQGDSNIIFSEYEIVYDDNSSQELDDDDVEHLIEEGQNEIEEESDQVYSS